MNRKNLLFRFLKKCEMPPIGSVFWHSISVAYNSFMICFGEILFHKTLKGNKNDPFLLVPVFSVGDMLMLFRSLPILNQESGISSPTVIHASNLTYVAGELGYKKTLALPSWKIVPLCKAVLFYPERHLNVITTLPWHFFRIDGLKNTSSINTIPCCVSQKTLREYFPDPKMKGKTVILSPYEQSFTSKGELHLPISFWEELAADLKNKGYWVYTNCDGKTDLPIKGTRQFFPSFMELGGLVDYAGFCVCVRSGFVDWCSSAQNAKFVVLYPSQRFYERFNMRLVWGREDMCELIYDIEPDSLVLLNKEILLEMEVRHK